MPQATRVIATVTDTENGVEAVVAQITEGYSVVLRDTDAHEALDIVRIFPTEAAALAYASTLVR